MEEKAGVEPSAPRVCIRQVARANPPATGHPLARVKGNRFTFYFYNAAGVLYLSQHMRAFLEIHAFNVLQAVKVDLSEVCLKYSGENKSFGVM